MSESVGGHNSAATFPTINFLLVLFFFLLNYKWETRGQTITKKAARNVTTPNRVISGNLHSAIDDEVTNPGEGVGGIILIWSERERKGVAREEEELEKKGRRGRRRTVRRSVYR